MKTIKRYSGVLVKHNDDVLMCKRNSKGSLPGVWSIPAGGVNKNESPYDAALREFHEETNLKITNKIKLIGFLNRTNRTGRKNNGLMYVFLYDVDDKIIPDLENAHDGDEHTECRYYTLENLPKKDENDQLHRLIVKILTKK
jgi:ADP-ribose pyrophosphatase YjhB (NUDIX family)